MNGLTATGGEAKPTTRLGLPGKSTPASSEERARQDTKDAELRKTTARDYYCTAGDEGGHTYTAIRTHDRTKNQVQVSPHAFDTTFESDCCDLRPP